MTEPPALILRGSFKKAPLALFLARALDQRLEGTLVLETDKGHKHAVLLIDGAPAKARLATPLVKLAEVVVDLELVPRSLAVSTGKRAAASGKAHEVVLFEEGHLDQTGLFVALRELLARQALALCDLPESTVFGLYRANYLSQLGPLPQWRVKPLPLVWRALTDHLPEERRQSALDKLGNHLLRMRFEAPVSRYRMSPEELSVVDMLKARPQTLAQLENSGVASPEVVRRVAGALLLTRQLEGSSSHGQPVGTSEPPESPKSQPPPSMRAARRSISAPRAAERPPSAPPTKPPSSRRSIGVQSEAFREAILRWEKQPPVTHYDALGVPREADTAAVQRAFFQLARQWHPDRLSEELAEYRGQVTKIFARMGEAHQILTDKVRRAEYDQRLAGVGSEEQEEIAKILGAASAFQRAEILFKKKDYPAALTEAKKASEGDPAQADYAGLYAWLSVLQGGSVDDSLKLMNEALEREPDNVRVLYFRAQLQKKAGKESAAMRDFKRILAIKPRHVEAARELRVFAMRKRSTPPKPEGGGLLGRFRKKG